MSGEEQFKQLLEAIAHVAGVNLSPITVSLYDKHLGQKYGYDQVNPYLEKYCVEAPRTRRLPAVSEIEEAMGAKQPSTEDMAREVVALIESALSRFGYPNESQAMTHIGTLGREIIHDMGGWVPFCMSIDSYDQMPSIRKQIRELAEAKLRQMPANVRVAQLPQAKTVSLVRK